MHYINYIQILKHNPTDRSPHFPPYRPKLASWATRAMISWSPLLVSTWKFNSLYSTKTSTNWLSLKNESSTWKLIQNPNIECSTAKRWLSHFYLQNLFISTYFPTLLQIWLSASYYFRPVWYFGCFIPTVFGAFYYGFQNILFCPVGSKSHKEKGWPKTNETGHLWR